MEKRKLTRNKLNRNVVMTNILTNETDKVKLKDYTIEGIAFTSMRIYTEHTLLKFSLDSKSYILYIIWGGLISNESIFEYGGRIFELK